MNKYSMMIFYQELESFLSEVQKLGMIDISRVDKPLDSHSKELSELIRRFNKAAKALEKFTEPGVDKFPVSSVDKNQTSLEEKLIICEESLENLTKLEADLAQTERDILDFSPWGDYDQKDLDKIKALGYEPRFFSVSESKYLEEWQDQYVLHLLNRVNGKCYFIILSSPGEDFYFPHPESKFPHTPLHTLRDKLDEIRASTEHNTSQLKELTLFAPEFRVRASLTGADLDRYLAAASSPREVEGKVALITGFAPRENSADVEKFLENSGIYYVCEEASTSDNPPIKLKNNFFSRLFEPIGELYMLPRYGELDLTPFFAPFYMLFFGFCLGDMGYGVTLLLLGGLAKYRFKSMKSYLTLLQFMGAGAIVMAAFSGVFYGTKIYEVFSLPDSINSLFFSDIKMFWFAIIFGLVHIIAARLISAIYAIKTKGIQHGLGNIGWILVIIWASFAYAKSMVDGLTLPGWFNYFGIGGAALILFFSATEGNLIVRLFKGTASFYDITGIFGDMLSYIRLFGLGTSGGILGMVVNSVAIDMLGIPYVGWLFTGIMLIVGHFAVLMLSSLGAFVHPMRLTFVEFYKNAGFSGGGRAFRPLKKQ
ncbi:MAG: V-type ATPase 116kDa subunit family protein [Bacteroidales bacterium]|nr:V-type ATPase 116kDa subunit family protein [Bacteroidales bacterium]MDD3988897.1 V-type ATPase 116kDa subunit family protein [Bacteroidales bacterium]